MTKLRGACAAAALTMMASGAAYADASANVGIMSDYIFRGYYQTDATAFAGIDVEADSGFYLGAWGVNLKEGLEYDVYLGYQGGGDAFTWNVGYTGYYYTDEFDNSYEELNLGFSWGFLTIDYALGDYKNAAGPPQGGEPEQTYQYVGATFAPERGPYYFIGRTDYKEIDRADMRFDDDGVPIPPYDQSAGRIPGTGKDGYWVELGKSFEILDDLELNVAAIYSGDVPQYDNNKPASVKLGRSDNSQAEYSLVVTLTKSIGIGN